MTQPFETTFILFADMLGFAALVEREGDELNELNPIFTGVELYSPSPAESLLGYRFIKGSGVKSLFLTLALKFDRNPVNGTTTPNPI